MTTVINACHSCAWFSQQKECIAFLDKIPDTIWFGKNDHKKPVKGDNGIQYDPISDKPSGNNQ